MASRMSCLLFWQRYCSLQATRQYSISRNLNLFKKWRTFFSMKKKRKMVEAKQRYQAGRKCALQGFEALLHNAYQSASDKELQATISFMTQCLKTHTVSAFRSLNAAATALDLFESRKNIQKAKVKFNGFYNWKNVVRQWHFRLYALNYLGQCWKRVQLQFSQRSHFR